MIKLRPNREKFAVLVASGMAQTQAYREAYPNTKSVNSTLWANSSRLMANDTVLARVKELKEESAKRVMWKREDSIRELSEIALRKAHIDKNTGEITPGAKDNDRIAAIKELNGMEGFNAPVKQEHTITERMTLADLRGKQSKPSSF